MASTVSRVRCQRSGNAVPWLASSSRFQPTPTPISKRPLLRKSNDEICFDVQMASRCAGSNTLAPRRSFVVTAAAIASTTKASCRCEYSSGKGSPLKLPGHGVSRLTGMLLCSGTQKLSKPRASISRASSLGSIAKSADIMVMPIFVLVINELPYLFAGGEQVQFLIHA